ncbi:Glutamyl-tRNA reductase [Pyrobaculum oguniense TE7]|uniref:Glutamyl-tRNA reductase n=1 Tax=Pyrobaculum oguniense (strain DSM 13380 / JCM 10595 / TE7) TaxID=698757 RepID=H6QAI7_PYROT|nr:Glutamyl-tRNA reductase [Pyrobaculum oguniense TE7]
MDLVNGLVALSLTHKELGVDELSKVANGVHRVCMSLRQPLFVLHTCNRVEAYLYNPPDEVVEIVKSGYAPYVEKVVERRGVDAARHLFRVAAGLESMLIGETDVLGQLEEAFDRQVRAGYTRGLLKTVVERAIRVGKRVRTETGISRGSRGLCSLSILYVKEKIDLTNARICVIGAGSVGRGLVKELIDAGARRLVVVNRSVEKAADLGVEVWPLSEQSVERCLEDFDVVFTAVATFEPIIKSVPKDARVRIIVDLGMPRNTAAGLPAEVVTIDSLRDLANRFNAMRDAEVKKAEEIVEKELAALERLLRIRWVEEVSAKVLEYWFKIAEEEGERAGGLEAKIAARTTVKRTLLPVVNYLKKVAVSDIDEAYRIISVLRLSYELKDL